MPANGKFVALEGSDGSGKGTHTQLLVDWLRDSGRSVTVADFPQYGQPSAYFVEQYLNGHFGGLDTIDAYKASLFYALDRYAASFKIAEAINRGNIVISNRYVGSNMAHQGGKLQDQKSRHEYLEWDLHTEYSVLGIPKPDLSIVLSMPPQTASKLIDQKGDREYIKSGTRDIHEADQNHLTNAYTTFNELCKLYPKDFHRIDCAPDGNVRSIESIQDEIRTQVTRLIG
jgi:dTMP kinase